MKNRAQWILLTGATGFVGLALLRELLDRGHRVLCLVRASAPDKARRRLAACLASCGCQAQDFFESGHLAVLRSDLHQPALGLDDTVIDALAGGVASVVHAAGSTVFETRHDGEPARTNLDGTREVFRLAGASGCRDWHLISTAYVCGECSRAEETRSQSPPRFRNDYEQCKWQAEQESAREAAKRGATLTIYRPSVVVGDSRTGHATRFSGIYYLIRAISMLARYADERDDVDRHQIPLRIHVDGDKRINLICIDQLASSFGELFDQSATRGDIYHLTHPNPPTIREIKTFLERRYDVGGGRFVGRRNGPTNGDRTPFEELFEDMTGSLSKYLFESPIFDRSRTDRWVSATPSPWNDALLRRLTDYAESVGWRPSQPSPTNGVQGRCAAYFERFLPDHIRQSTVGGIAELDLDARFVVEDEPRGDWLCRFRDGELMEVLRCADQPAEVTFRTTRDAFWRSVAGKTSGAELFLTGQARIDGDLERAMKLTMILEQFMREFPCQQDSLPCDEPSTC